MRCTGSMAQNEDKRNTLRVVWWKIW